MGKFKVPSWLQTPAAPAGAGPEVAKKKQHRRSFTTFTQHLRQKPESAASSTPTIVEAASNTGASRLLALARLITAEAEKLDAYLRKNETLQPGFGVDAPADFPPLPPEIQRSRQAIVHASQELGSLVRGPRESVRWSVWSVRRMPPTGSPNVRSKSVLTTSLLVFGHA